MPSRPLDNCAWNFSPVFDLIESDTNGTISPTLRPSEIRSPHTPADGGVGLGNFWKLYESLGMQQDVAAPPLPPLDESELSTSDDLLLPSPMIGSIPASVSHLKPLSEEEGDVAVLPLPATTKKQRRKARRAAERALQENTTDEERKDETSQSLKTLPVISSKDLDVPVDTPTKPSRTLSNVGAKIRPSSSAPTLKVLQAPQTPSPAQRPIPPKRLRSSALPSTPKAQIRPARFLDKTQYVATGTPSPTQHQQQDQLVTQPTINQVQFSQPFVSINSDLVPSTVRPITFPRNSSYHDSARLHMPAVPISAPVSSARSTSVRSRITIRSQIDRHFHLFEKLLIRFPEDRKWLIAPRQMVNENTTVEGIHVFVDASNIMIGFKDMIRSNSLQSFEMSFDSLALLMERRRPVAKRCFVGSHREANPLPQITRLIETSKAVGYECSVQEQVYIAREESKKKKFFNDVSRMGWQKAIQRRSGSGSDSETGAEASGMPSTPKWVEQGVDELLHLKMCQSMLDSEEPSTMVLATGDGAEAEMSDGFLAHVERALRKGWKVELVTWKQQTNGGYKRKAFRQRWGEQFTITELDDFLEDLIDTR